jgi:phage terminase small subunit
MNATQAATRAGYSPKTANEQGARLLADASIRQEIDRKRERLSVKCDITVAWIINRLVEVADRCMQKEAVLDARGQPTGEWKFDSRGATKALELLGKHFGAWAADEKPVDLTAFLTALTNGKRNGHENGERREYDA